MSCDISLLMNIFTSTFRIFNVFFPVRYLVLKLYIFNKFLFKLKLQYHFYICHLRYNTLNLSLIMAEAPEEISPEQTEKIIQFQVNIQHTNHG